MPVFLNNEKNSNTVDGYIQDGNKKPVYFPVERTIRVKTYYHNGKIYFKTMEIATLLGMKQPFYFTACCRDYLGEQSILKGEQTVAFRDAMDSDRITFIEAEDLLDYLLEDKTRFAQKYIPGMYQQTVEALQILLAK